MGKSVWHTQQNGKFCIYAVRNRLCFAVSQRNATDNRKGTCHASLLETGWDGEQAMEKAEEMLTYFQLPENLWDIYPNTFSGGERLRLNLAHTMVKRPRLMLLDEPTASLDNKSKVLVKDMLQKLKQEGTSMIGIFHDLEFMDGLCDRVFNISEGTFQ